ncbi:hypothetical protein GCM10018785_52270 [Streptomyces longispororuber]|uniref:Uncharacterized protein n=1 Tax=Streptomyces longispororuber TaxID=68230 RepID=A0A918ZZ50_9ACTN|nr:DUF6339 family protein [Streptomyces longispororuber]GHE77552.1 hypothetical protein GCM10018785_52270 [Streptomyces longispororuber]
MTHKPNYLPERLALLSDLNAAQYVTEGLLNGKEDVPAIALSKIVEPLPYDGARAALAPVRELVDDAMCEYRDEKPTKADAWLAPRLHATLRLNRREAADRRLWNFLALGVAPDYVVWRFLPEPNGKEKSGEAPKVAYRRFRGAHYTQAFARLWWMAELFRNGSDYRPVARACAIQDMINTVLRLDVIDHRPTAQAMVRLLDRGTVTTGREVNALAGAVNASAATLMYDVVAPDVERDGRPVQEWVEAAETAGPVPRRMLPEGPDEEQAPEGSVEALADYFTELLVDAPVRGRPATEDIGD